MSEICKQMKKVECLLSIKTDIIFWKKFLLGSLVLVLVIYGIMAILQIAVICLINTIIFTSYIFQMSCTNVECHIMSTQTFYANESQFYLNITLKVVSSFWVLLLQSSDKLYLNKVIDIVVIQYEMQLILHCAFV